MGQEPLRVVESIFRKYDTDGSKTISATELIAVCYDLGYYLTPEESDVALKLLDKDGRGSIDFKEFLQFWRDSDKFKKLDESQTERVQQAIAYFRFFDKKNCGSVSHDEYASLHADLIKNNLLPASVTVAHGLETMDENRDGKVEFNEFMDYLDRVQGA